MQNKNYVKMNILNRFTNPYSNETKISLLMGCFLRDPTLPSPKGREIAGNSLPFGEGRGGVLTFHTLRLPNYCLLSNHNNSLLLVVRSGAVYLIMTVLQKARGIDKFGTGQENKLCYEVIFNRFLHTQE
jgi:hypothetical protein